MKNSKIKYIIYFNIILEYELINLRIQFLIYIIVINKKYNCSIEYNGRKDGKNQIYRGNRSL